MVFQESAAKLAIGFFSEIKIFENTAFGRVTEVPPSSYLQLLLLLSLLISNYPYI